MTSSCSVYHPFYPKLTLYLALKIASKRGEMFYCHTDIWGTTYMSDVKVDRTFYTTQGLRGSGYYPLPWTWGRILCVDH